MTETDAVTKRILLWLALNGHPCWRQNLGSHHRHRLASASRGVGDIIAVMKPSGVHLEIEIKTGKDRLRKDQVKHAERIEKAGGKYIVASSLDDFLRKFYDISIGGVPEFAGRIEEKE